MKREAYVEFNDFPKPITGSFLTNEQEQQFKNAFKDFVQVIRCKDCNNRGTSDCPIEELCNGWLPLDDWFCADGERKE